MSQSDTITVQTFVSAPPEAAWAAFTDPDAITQWNFASPDWHCPSASVDLREGGRQSARMEARDGSMGFEFGGTYEEVDAPNALALLLDDGRLSRTTFEAAEDGTRVSTTFDPDGTAPAEMQRDGWQTILDNYKRYTDGQVGSG